VTRRLRFTCEVNARVSRPSLFILIADEKTGRAAALRYVLALQSKIFGSLPLSPVRNYPALYVDTEAWTC
jgi:hypothetical protein